MQNRMRKKGRVLLIIFLFLGTCIIPNTSSFNEDIGKTDIEQNEKNDDKTLIKQTFNEKINSNNDWTEQMILLPPDEGGGFGKSVSLDGFYAILGVPYDDDNGISSGSAYIFKRSGTTWTEQAKLLASDGEAYDYFGFSVSIAGDYTVIGAQWAEGTKGSAYIFKRLGETWTEQAKLLASDGEWSDYFGKSVSIYGDYAVIGAPADDNSNGEDAGSVYIFKHFGDIWVEQAKLLASDGETENGFGWSVSIYGDYIIIGTPYDNDNGMASGSAYIFKRSGTTWTEQAKLLASDGAVYDLFGESASIDGDYAIVGALGYEDSGSAYVFYNVGGNQLIADFTWTPSDPNPGDDITFDASDSYDPYGYITLYEWDWDNNNLYEESHTNPITTHSWPIYGNYPVRLRVTDNDGNMATRSYTVGVGADNNPPNKPTTPIGPSNINVGQTGQYKTSAIDPDGDMVKYRVLWGDGTISSWTNFVASGTEVTMSKYWTKKGTFKIKSEARDIYGAKSSWSSALTVTTEYPENQPPYKPKLINPYNECKTVMVDTKLSWSGGDPDPNDDIFYEIYLGKNPSPPKVDEIVSSAKKKLLTWKPLGNLQYNTKYYWKINAIDEHGASKTSSIGSFTTRLSQLWKLDKRFTKAETGGWRIPKDQHGEGKVNYDLNTASISITLESEGGFEPATPYTSSALGYIKQYYYVPYQNGGTRDVKIKANLEWNGFLASAWDGLAGMKITFKIMDTQTKKYILEDVLLDEYYDMFWFTTYYPYSGSKNIEKTYNLKEKGKYSFKLEGIAWTITYWEPLNMLIQEAKTLYGGSSGVKYNFIEVYIK